MPLYVYGCDDREHPEKEVTHRMADDPEVRCDTCGGLMHRVPQVPMALAYNPEQLVAAWMADNYIRKKKGKPRPNKYRVKRPNWY
jgi:hypothetical protein